ncbi:bifunctional hydroxymethylpyrimidine kinase/phosphomethylpyrimidine kinase [Granulicella sp. L60]|uniref:bifunctional hydroxymethylpyrimidine kinase/phosphomethylpyrimidine kinase n=1 Tax=Granulicella sp. L60 TaxID=1641866 RepID=UPI00131BED0B|nr:bifunctional hydroxymethylpyrimidine kinase/phosphomethylpyrimidine kinase [Granulicella sp. L60]
MRTVLAIAGFDPSSGAGVTADLMVFAAHGMFGTSCVTSLTVQSTVGVMGASTVAAGLVRETLDCLQEDLPAAGIKIGMLATAETVGVVADFLAGLRVRVPVVLDPVVRSSSGRELLDAEGVAVMRERLLPLVDWVTPNMDELGVLTGRVVGRREEMEEAAVALQGMGRGLSVVATGGHLEGPDDLVVVGGEMRWLAGERVAGRATHGTGCAFSSALLCGVVEGVEAFEAALGAKKYVAEAMRTASPMGRGRGPLNHLWTLNRT